MYNTESPQTHGLLTPKNQLSDTMKLLSASAVLFTSAMADKWSQLGDLWTGVAQNENISEDDRKIIELFTISSVANYGCWCRFNNYKPYKGQAQDTVDEACMQWYKNYDCLHLDYSTNTPWFRCNIDTPYNDTLTTLQEPFELTTDYSALMKNVIQTGISKKDKTEKIEIFLFFSFNF